MTVFKTQKEVEARIKDGVLAIEGDVKLECSISISARIVVINGNINCRDITCGDITCGDINCWNINCWNIYCRDINCWNINCEHISYYAFCQAYNNIKCKSWTARREKHQDPICLDGKLEIIKDIDDDVAKAIALLESKGKLKDGKILI